MYFCRNLAIPMIKYKLNSNYAYMFKDIKMKIYGVSVSEAAFQPGENQSDITNLQHLAIS